MNESFLMTTKTWNRNEMPISESTSKQNSTRARACSARACNNGPRRRGSKFCYGRRGSAPGHVWRMVAADHAVTGKAAATASGAPAAQEKQGQVWARGRRAGEGCGLVRAMHVHMTHSDDSKNDWVSSPAVLFRHFAGVSVLSRQFWGDASWNPSPKSRDSAARFCLPRLRNTAA